MDGRLPISMSWGKPRPFCFRELSWTNKNHWLIRHVAVGSLMALIRSNRQSLENVCTIPIHSLDRYSASDLDERHLRLLLLSLMLRHIIRCEEHAECLWLVS